MSSQLTAVDSHAITVFLAVVIVLGIAAGLADRRWGGR